MSSCHLRIHLILVTNAFSSWALASTSNWLSTLPLVNSLAQLAFIGYWSSVLACTLRVIDIAHLLDLVCAHDAAPEDAVVGSFDSTQDLCLVSLVHSNWTTMHLIRMRILASATSEVHVRTINSPWSHVVKHDWALRVPSSLLVQRRANPTSAKLSLTSLEARAVDGGSTDICWVLPSMPSTLGSHYSTIWTSRCTHES